MKELKLTEGRNTGIPKIKRALKNNGSPEPIFETNESRDYFITTILVHEGFEQETKVAIKASDKILDYLRKNEFITTAIASNLLDLSAPRSRAILSQMAKKGLILSKGANKNKRYKLNK